MDRSEFATHAPARKGKTSKRKQMEKLMGKENRHDPVGAAERPNEATGTAEKLCARSPGRQKQAASVLQPLCNGAHLGKTPKVGGELISPRQQDPLAALSEDSEEEIVSGCTSTFQLRIFLDICIVVIDKLL